MYQSWYFKHRIQFQKSAANNGHDLLMIMLDISDTIITIKVCIIF